MFTYQESGITGIGNFNLLEHLRNNNLNVLVVNCHTLQTIYGLNFLNQIFGQFFNTQYAQNIVRSRSTVNQ